MCLGRATGIAAGYLADLAFGDPRRGHPVALFGRGASAPRAAHLLRRPAGRASFTRAPCSVRWRWRASRGSGSPRRRGPASVAALTAATTFVALGGTSLTRTGTRMADLLARDDVDAARRLLPSLCGRDPAALDLGGLTRAAVESVAENTSDAQVAPLMWAAIGGVPALLVYRGANTLDAMIGHRSPRYQRFGWAAARFDDALNFVAARVTGVLVAICAPVVGGSPADACGRGGATPPGTRAQTRVSSKHRSRVRLASGSAGQRNTRTSWRSGPPSATDRAPQIADLRSGGAAVAAVQLVSAVLATMLRSAPLAVAVGEFLLGGERRAGGPAVRGGLLSSARPDLRNDEVAQPDWREDAERDPLDAVGQERPGVQMRQADRAEAARLIVDQLQIGPGQRNVQQRRDLRGVDRVHLLRPVLPERRLALGRGLGVAQPRDDRHRPAGAGAMGGTREPCSGFT